MLAGRPKSVELPKGLDAIWDAATGRIRRLAPRKQRFLAMAKKVLAHEADYKDLSDARLREEAQRFREVFLRGRDTRDILFRAFAMVREVAWRKRGEKPYLVQVAGALALDAGCIAEMATGEGKTLTATLPATIAGWRGRGCHVITVNDYLAKRDAEWMSHDLPLLRASHGVHRGTDARRPSGARPTRPTSPTARTRRSARTSCATGSRWAGFEACRWRC